MTRAQGALFGNGVVGGVAFLVTLLFRKLFGSRQRAVYSLPLHRQF